VIPLSPLASMLIAIGLYQLVEDKLFKTTLPGVRPELIVFFGGHICQPPGFFL